MRLPTLPLSRRLSRRSGGIRSRGGSGCSHTINNQKVRIFIVVVIDNTDRRGFRTGGNRTEANRECSCVSLSHRRCGTNLDTELIGISAADSERRCQRQVGASGVFDGEDRIRIGSCRLTAEIVTAAVRYICSVLFEADFRCGFAP